MTIYSKKQQQIAEKIQETSALSNWKDWKWQLKNSVHDIATFERLLGVQLPPALREQCEATLATFPLAVTPYYLSLIDRNEFANDPVFRQSFPSPAELHVGRYDLEDPLSEDADSPVPGITHRYPDRVLFHISNVCAMYCRHCTRKRKVGDVDSIPDREEISNGLDYIRNNPVIRDVLLSGGDPLMLSDEYLDWILGELRSIPHVQIIRIGSRIPVVLPYRVTDKLVSVLKRHHPLWLNTHFNHPREITTSAKEALAKLADAGIPLGNQTVLLAGVNDCPLIIKTLIQRLVENRVRPYYLYQCDLSEGLTHFRTPVGKGMEIMESLIGHTSGFAVPTYVIDAPGGGGKIPVMPNYLITLATNKVVLRNYEGVITTYQEPESYEPVFCDRNCAECHLDLNLEEDREYGATGIERLLSDYDATISLTPEDNDRMKRRNND
ncbi:lysine 2,3-aminomutase [Trichlorobacter lovleyi]|uniref:lysine 2,3-aminomutase n=1 Tax=Trichlorobacter lovleyi TaxID=313985 RepID=UPI00223F7F87|nr:lysine 2,3-aminomutase [Trichlorobacter lovleyi]QOX78851.1 lysine 2,3-aminomutase [Trichlorobacter lovleyi]